MKTSLSKLTKVISLTLFLLNLILVISSQTAVTNNSHSSEGAMEGVNLQRTNAYRTSGVTELKVLLWKSDKLFKINYAAALTPGFDGSSLNSADIGFSEPVLIGDLIYFQLCVSLSQNFVFALDRNTGRGIWMFKLRDAISAPAVADGSLYIVATDGNLYSLDAKSGAEKWRYNAKDQKWNVYSSPAVAAGALYFTSLNGILYALDVATRQVKWTFKSKGMLTSPAFSGEYAYIANEKSFVYAIDIHTGQEKWSFKAKGRPGNPIVADETVYLRTEEGNLYAIDANTGQQKWFAQVGGRVQPVFPVVSVRIGTSLALYDKTIFFAGSDKGSDYLFAIDAQNGQQRWKFKLDGPCRAPIVADGIIYLGSFGKFYVIDAKAGTQRWFLKTKSEFEGKTVKNVASSPAIADNTVYFVTDEGFFYAVK